MINWTPGDTRKQSAHMELPGDGGIRDFSYVQLSVVDQFCFGIIRGGAAEPS